MCASDLYKELRSADLSASGGLRRLHGLEINWRIQVRRLPQYDLPDLRGRRRLTQMGERKLEGKGQKSEIRSQKSGVSGGVFLLIGMGL